MTCRNYEIELNEKFHISTLDELATQCEDGKEYEIQAIQFQMLFAIGERLEKIAEILNTIDHDLL